MDELGILDDGLLLVDGVNEFLEENPRNSSHEMVEVLSTTVESASESTDSDETVNSVQSNEIWSRCAGNGNATNEVGEESRKNLYEGKYRIERETLLSTDRERGFLTAIFGSANLHKLWFPIKPDQLPSTEDALSNYLIENLIPTELNRFFAPAAWCQLKTLVERKRRAWTCRLCSIPRNRNMMECETCHTWFHMCCVQAVRTSTYVSFDSWVCTYCIERMKKCIVVLHKLSD
ncbi:uncharacterized protein LOC111269780 isoform X2 [Varroa jacobsoni]|uniref:uncharacterized protein LOC111269780 isoform X2 n=1 Tax=Varroa jacobsoni TaxID=62625 RepID=UPI000BF764E9|nr:uncharacterized protein LOC111269780 isoform X2 [Varroa jacobsoni]